MSLRNPDNPEFWDEGTLQWIAERLLKEHPYSIDFVCLGTLANLLNQQIQGEEEIAAFIHKQGSMRSLENDMGGVLHNVAKYLELEIKSLEEFNGSFSEKGVQTWPSYKIFTAQATYNGVKDGLMDISYSEWKPIK